MENKKRSLIITVFLGILLLISGTFAWVSFSQQALNEKSGTGDPGGGRIHDDYNKESGNKDIYGENYGDQDLLVRIKLSEYFEINETPLVSGTTKSDRKTWTPYILPTVSNEYRNYVTWELGGEKVFLPTFNTNKDNLSTDAAGDGIDFLENGPTAEGTGEHDAFKDGESVSNPADPSQTHVAKPTLTQNRAPISMADWKTLPEQEQVGDFWVIDIDGWAYWANKLAPSQSTSLLLNQLNYNEPQVSNIEGDWYYGIDVIGEFVNIVDKDKFPNSEQGKPSEDGQDLIDKITGEATYRIEFTTDVSNVTMDAGESQQFSAKVVKIDKKGNETDVVTELVWSIENQNTKPDLGTQTSVDNTGNVTLRPFENDSITINVSSSEYALKDSFKITVKPLIPGTSFNFFGEDYLYLKDLSRGDRLILRKTIKSLVGFSKVDSGLDYNNSELNTAMKQYYSELSTEAQAIVQPVQSIFTSITEYTAVGLDKEGFIATKPGEDFTEVTSDGEKKAFALSIAELCDLSGPGKVFPDLASRSTRASRWWLRSHVDEGAWNINTFGKLTIEIANSMHGLRPALIINQ